MEKYLMARHSSRVWAILALIAVFALLQLMGMEMHAVHGGAAAVGLGALMVSGEISGDIMKALDKVETKLAAMSEKADGEMKDLGKVSSETKSAVDALGVEQRTLAERLLAIEQKSSAVQDQPDAALSCGAQFVKDAGYAEFQTKTSRGSVGLELKNTVTNAVAGTFSERRPGVVEGAFRLFTLEELLVAIPTSSNAIDWVRENVFVNNAAEVAEGGALPQSTITFVNETMPVQDVGHLVKISRQLAMDNAAMAAYIDRRMIYGVDLRVENQIIAGNGTSPNLSGLTKAGNFTPHGYTAASLAALGLDPENRFDIIGKMIGDCAAADYPADVIVLNTADWWTLRLSKDKQGRYILGDPGSSVVPMLFGVPVVASNAMAYGKVWVGSLDQAATLHNREGIMVDLSDSDENNFQLRLVSVRATRRVALTVEKPGACRYGDLVPA
ncbi:phage major capsid protein [Duganella sp. FT94W]|uniref:Phage major capsid protein n=1 Tax=Duganella lactea TaxID=2692173 RepID=A0ABW9VEX8_9BURK|nr:phage major capsid protein [Duganella lactea]MYM37255.1 phage major capsid protein [Duganella lactea]